MSRVDPSAVAANVAAVRRRIATAGGAERVRLVAVTKGFGPDAVEAAVAAGVDDVGESYAQEMLGKLEALATAKPPVRWHFVGRLQRNKVERVAPHVEWWHTVDREPLGVEIARCAPGAAVLVQVNVSGESTKAGCAPEQAGALVQALGARGLSVRGLMTIARPGPASHVRAEFRRLAELAAELALPELSMGMSDDLDIAVEEGATIVRVGRSLFGSRP